MPGGKVVYVPLHPPPEGATKTTSAGEWTVDFAELEAAITPKTKMIVLNTPHNPVGKVFSKEELLKIGELCVKNNIIILSDEVYDKLYYTPFTRIATLSPELEQLTITVALPVRSFMPQAGEWVTSSAPHILSSMQQQRTQGYAIHQSRRSKKLPPLDLKRPMVLAFGRRQRRK